MKEKMLEFVAKIRSIEIYPATVHVFFSMCLYRKVFFGHRIIVINDKQEEKLMKTCEPAVLKKLGFRENFSRLCLHSRRSALGIELMKSKTILVTLALKFYDGYKRLRTKVSKKRATNEQLQLLQEEHKSHPIETP